MKAAKPKISRMVSTSKKTSIDENGSQKSVGDLDIRPGGMLVQMRDFNSNHNPLSIPMIKVRVKYGSFYHNIHITSHASFGELKKLLAEPSGLHPQDQKLIFKNKERDSRSYLDVARVKDGSKIVLIEDTLSRERRCLEMLKNSNFEKFSKLLEEVSLDVNKLSQQVESLQGRVSRGMKITEKEVESLTEMLMRKLIQLDGIDAVGDLRLQRRDQVREVQKKIETLDMMKLHNCTILKGNNGDEEVQKKQQRKSNETISITKGKQNLEQNKNGLKIVKEASTLRHSESVVVTTKWETFD